MQTWEYLEEQHRTSFNREYVACHEPHEFNWLVENVMQVLPHFRKSVVERSIEEVCQAMKNTPRKRAEFFQRLHITLENHKLSTKEILKKVNKL